MNYFIPEGVQLCQLDSDCNWLHRCNDQLTCQHYSVFQLNLYQIAIYCIIPLTVGTVNIGGHSMGLMKILLLAILLNYSIGQSTQLIQPMVAGAALFNLFTLVPKRHMKFPQKSLINYNFCYILIPPCIFASSIGSIVEQLLPEIAKYILTILIFTYFGCYFLKKGCKINQEVRQKQTLISSTLNIQQNSQNNLEEKYISIIQKYNLNDIATIFLIFVIFQLLVYLAYGRFSFLKFNKCDYKFIISNIVLIILILGYLYVLNIRLKKRFSHYNQNNIIYDVDISKLSNFLIVVLGALLGGFCQGIIGVGSGSLILYSLLLVKLPITVASSTAAFQIFFIGASAVFVNFVEGQVALYPSLFFFGLSFIGGGIFTVIFRLILKKKDEITISKVILYITGFLSLLSVICVFPMSIMEQSKFGWGKLLETHFQC